MTDRPNSFRVAAVFALATWLLMAWQAAHADAATGTLRIREVTFGKEDARIVVSASDLSGELSAGDITLTEGGTRVDGVKVEQIAAEQVNVTVALVFDVSGSTAGKPLAAAKAAAKQFIRTLPAQVRVGVFPFAQTARQSLGFTTDRARLFKAIDALRASGATALYDGVALAAGALEPVGGHHDIVVFSDGKDTASKASLSSAIAAARSSKALVTSVGLVTKDYDWAALSAMATSTGGATLNVENSAGLATAFSKVARNLASQYALTFRSSSPSGEVEYAVSYAGNSDRAVVLKPEASALADNAVPYRGVPKPPVGVFANATGFLIGIGMAALAFLLIAGLLVSGNAAAPADRVLRKLSSTRRRSRREDGNGISQAAVAFVEKLPKRADTEEALQLKLERAGWAWRAGEFRTLQIAATIGAGLVGSVLVGKLWLGAVLAAAGWLVPRLFLANRVAHRKALFLTQLPDTLQLLSGSLKAGYAFLQAIDALVKEAPAPTSKEFSRVLAEARLGMPIEEAMSNMADRIDAEDFRWVVLAVNIQRQIGGNLAELLDTVSGTLREREQVRRQIRVLSAEGRLSATILCGLPFLLAGYIMLVNPKYLKPLFEENVGRAMLVVAITLMGAGVAWMRKLVRIDV